MFGPRSVFRVRCSLVQRNVPGMSGPTPDLFQRLTQAMCADASHSHCILNTFLALPAAALFMVMIPFVFRWCEADTAEDAAAASEAPLDTHDRSPAGRKGPGWKPFAIGDVSTGAGVAARGRQSVPLCIAQAVASLGLALSPALQMVFQANGDVAGQSVYTGTKAWALVSFAAWALNGLALFLRAYHALPIPDYQQAWCVIKTCYIVFLMRHFCISHARVRASGLDHLVLCRSSGLRAISWCPKLRSCCPSLRSIKAPCSRIVWLTMYLCINSVCFPY